MADRRGVILLMFDMPTLTKDNRHNYNKFIKNIKSEGYCMFQKSIYLKLVKNNSFSKFEIDKIVQIAPENSNISLLPMKLTQFEKIKILSKNNFDMNIFADNTVYM